MDYKFEISRKIPDGLPARYLKDRKPAFSVFESIVTNRETSTGFATEAINVNTKKIRLLRYSKHPIEANEAVKLAEMVWRSGIAGARRLEVERHFGMNYDIRKCVDAITAALNDSTLRQEFELQEEHVHIAQHILDTLSSHNSTLIESESDISLMCLLVGGIIKRSRMNDSWNKSFYPGESYISFKNMPITIATPSIAASETIINKYLPKLNEILLSLGIIKYELTARIYKGRENYVCSKRLAAQIQSEQNASAKKQLEQIWVNGESDLAKIAGLKYRTKKRINVVGRCDAHSCPEYETCAYMNMMRFSQTTEYDFELCSHRYAISDIQRRKDGLRPLITNFQSLIVFDPQKFLLTARSAYGTTLTNAEITKVADRIGKLSFSKSEDRVKVMPLVELLTDKNSRLFKGLQKATSDPDDGDNEVIQRSMMNIDNDAARHIRKIKEMATELTALLDVRTRKPNDPLVKPVSKVQLRQITAKLNALIRTVTDLSVVTKNLYWYSSDGKTRELRSSQKDLGAILYADQWGKRIPTIFVSHPNSTNGDFSDMKRNLGVEALGYRLTAFIASELNNKNHSTGGHENVEQ